MKINKIYSILILVLFTTCSKTNQEEVDRKVISLSYRLHPNFWQTDKQIARTIEYFQKHAEAVNELALFDMTLPYRPLRSLNEIRKTCQIMAERIQQLKDAGIERVGVNILSTIGFRNPEGVAAAGFQQAIPVGGIKHGIMSQACVNDSAFIEYTKEYYRINARMNPDFIWIDDDYRNVTNACFCSTCLNRFGFEGNKEKLIVQLDQPENADLRMRWTHFQEQSMNDFSKAIKEAVDEINPDIDIGVMTIGYDHALYGGYDFGQWMKTLNAKMCRPGHGFYHDDQPRLILKKIMSVSRQVRDCPPSVTDIQYELENWPYVTTQKSVKTFVNEITLAHLAGCTGVACNIFYERGNVNYNEYDPFLNAVAENKALWEIINQYNKLPLTGFYPLDSRYIHAKRNVDATSWFDDNKAYDIQKAVPFSESGIPLTTSPQYANVYLLTGKTAEAYSEKELREMLSKAVWIDAEALDVLWEKGLGHLTGVKRSKNWFFGTELFTGHTFNGKYANDGRRAQGWAGSHYLEVKNQDVEVLSDFYTMQQEKKGPCFTIFENELGGKVAVTSYYPWQYNGRNGKQHQLMQTADWLSNKQMPLIIDKNVRIVPYVRMNKEKNKFMIALLNTSFDEIENLPITVRANPDNLYLINELHEKEKLNFTSQKKEIKIKISSLKPWSVMIIIGE